MYICLCNGVTEKQVAAAVAQGDRCVKDLRSRLRVTAKCGKCAASARQCIKHSVECVGADGQAACMVS